MSAVVTLFCLLASEEKARRTHKMPHLICQLLKNLNGVQIVAASCSQWNVRHVQLIIERMQLCAALMIERTPW
jgi:hypothetical protein